MLNHIYFCSISIEQLILNHVPKSSQLYSRQNDQFKHQAANTMIALRHSSSNHFSSHFVPSLKNSWNHLLNEQFKYFESAKNKMMYIPIDDMMIYLRRNKEFYTKLHSFLFDSLMTFVLKNCSIFECVGHNCYQQMYGESVSNFAFGSKPLNKSKSRMTFGEEEKLVNNILCEMDQAISHNRKRKCVFNQNCVPIKKFKYNSFLEEVASSKRKYKYMEYEDDYEINRRKMLYSKNSLGKISKNFIFQKPNISSLDLFNVIYNRNFQKEFDTNENLLNHLQWIINRHKTCQFENLLLTHCHLENGYFDKHPYELRLALEQHLIYKQIQQFVDSVFYYVFPVGLFGDKKNYDKFEESLKLLYISSLRNCICIKNLTYGLDINKVTWFSDKIDCATKKKLFNLLVLWISDYFITLLRSKFYITESSPYKSMLFYYRYDLWSKIKSRFLNDCVDKGLFEKKDYNYQFEKQLSNINFLSNLRLIPKTSSLRLINPLKISKTQAKANSLKETLEVLFIFLKKLRLTQNTSSLIPTKSVLHQKLKDLKNLHPNHQFFCVRADIAECYPSINQQKMFSILEKLIDSNEKNKLYFMKKYDVVTKNKGKFFVRHCLYFDDGEKSLAKISQENGSRMRDSIILPKFYVKKYRLGYILDSFKSYLFSSYITNGPRSYYHLKRGIKQGGALSSELCVIYIQDLVKHYFSDFGLSQDEIFITHADDFLFISNSLDRAKQFIQVLQNGFEEYQLKINVNKLEANFDCPQLNIVKSNVIYFGHSIDPSLQLKADYTSYYNQNITNSFNFNPLSSLESIITNLISMFNDICYYYLYF